MTKNCKLPEGWKDRRRPEIIANAKDPKTRGKAYRELFDYSTSNREVATFLCEAVHHIMPEMFMPTSKNKKILNKKIL